MRPLPSGVGDVPAAAALVDTLVRGIAIHVCDKVAGQGVGLGLVHFKDMFGPCLLECLLVNRDRMVVTAAILKGSVRRVNQGYILVVWRIDMLLMSRGVDKMGIHCEYIDDSVEEC